MIDEGASVDAEELRRGDPYGLDLPTGWSARYRDRTAVYENDRGDHRVRIVEFSKGLSLYWWVDVYVGEEEWHRQEVGLGESYTDPEAAVAAVESYLDVVAADGDDGAAAERERGSAPPPHAPGPDGWRLEDASPGPDGTESADDSEDRGADAGG